MPDPSVRYRINAPKVAADTIDGEVVVINFESGNYYSLLGSAASVWSVFQGAASVDDATAALRGGYDVDDTLAAAAAATFLDRLLDEGLVVPAVGNDANAVDPAAAPATATGDRVAFVEPVLERFDDLADLILLDPVHEVEEGQGWPYPKIER